MSGGAKKTQLDRIIAAGEFLADSPRWQSPLAAATGVSQSMLFLIADGQRILTPKTERRIGAGLIKEADSMVRRAGRLRAMGEAILNNVKK